VGHTNYKVSIVVPVYNVEKYVRQCIESALNQTLREIQIVCIDDGSTDNSPQILDEYAAQDSRIKVIHKPNAGYGQTMNVGMDAASGEYFAILEADDVVRPRMYETLYKIASRNDVDVVKANFCRFELDRGKLIKKPVKIANKTSMYERVINPREETRLVLREAPLYTWAGIYRRDFLYKNGIRHNETPGASYQDNGFWFQTVSMAESIFFHNEEFYMLRRDNPNSSIYNRGKVYAIRDEYEFIADYLSKRPGKVTDEMKQCYWSARFSSYWFSFERIDDIFKEEFLEHIKNTFSKALETNPLEKLYYTRDNWSRLQEIVNSTEEFLRSYNLKRARLAIKADRGHGWIWHISKSLQWSLKARGFGGTLRFVSKRLTNKLSTYLQKRRKPKRLTKTQRLKSIQKRVSDLREEQIQFKSDIQKQLLDIKGELLWAQTYYAKGQKTDWLQSYESANRSASSGYSLYGIALEILNAIRPEHVLILGDSQIISLVKQYSVSEKTSIRVLKDNDDWLQWLGVSKEDENPLARILENRVNSTYNNESVLIIFDGIWGVNEKMVPMEVLSSTEAFIHSESPFVMLLSDCASSEGKRRGQVLTRVLSYENISFDTIAYRGVKSTKLWYSSEFEQLRML
jgi:glycosyltransferase involved in cell wall biosynthesis